MTTTFKWASVTQVNPLRIKMDGDTAALTITPDSLVDPMSLSLNTRVRVELTLRKCIIHGASKGYDGTRYGVVGTWINGLVPVTLEDGTSINAYLEPSAVDVKSGANVAVRRTGSGLWLIETVFAANPNFLPQIALTLNAGWTNVQDATAFQGATPNYFGLRAGAIWHRATASKTVASAVSIKGAIVNTSGAAWAANTVIMTLPVAFRPLQQKRLNVYTTSGYTGLIVETNGNVYSDLAIPALTSVMLDQLSWTNDPAIVWTNLTFLGTWAQATITGCAIARVGKDSAGRVWYEGLVKGGASASNIANIPAGFRWTGIASLSGGTIFNSYELSAATRVGRTEASAAWTTGAPPNAVLYRGSGTSTGTSLDEISYMPDGATYTTPIYVTGSTYGNGYNLPGIIQTSDSMVALKGTMNVTASAVAFQLPPGMRPSAVMRFSYDGGGVTEVWPDGSVIPSSTSTFAFDGIRFTPEQ